MWSYEKELKQINASQENYKAYQDYVSQYNKMVEQEKKSQRREQQCYTIHNKK